MLFNDKFKAKIQKLCMIETKGEALDGDQVDEIANYLNKVNGNT